MWFRFPEGTTELSLQQQNFRPEYTDKDTHVQYFRAPDHFAPMILELGMGFARVEQPKGAPKDFSEDEQRERFARLEQEPQRINEETNAQLAALRTENADLRNKVEQLEARVGNAELRADEAEKELEESKKDTKPAEKK